MIAESDRLIVTLIPPMEDIHHLYCTIPICVHFHCSNYYEQLEEKEEEEEEEEEEENWSRFRRATITPTQK